MASETVDRQEVDRFEKLAAEWWDLDGPFRPLHQLNPVRIGFIKNQICRYFNRNEDGINCLDGLRILDLGCGGGLVSEPLFRLGAQVTGIDPGEGNIEAARRHAQAQGMDIDYRVGQAQMLIEAGERFDVVLCLEVVEHVPNVAQFVEAQSGLLVPGGMMIFSTLNRTLKSFALAIVGAEYILRWLEPGTHQWERFVKPTELGQAIKRAGLEPYQTNGMIFNPLRGEWQLSQDMDVNYFYTAIDAANQAEPRE